MYMCTSCRVDHTKEDALWFESRALWVLWCSGLGMNASELSRSSWGQTPGQIPGTLRSVTSDRMESSTLRSNTAAILQALGKLGHRQDASSDSLKKDEPDSMKTDVTVKEEPGIKMEASAEQSSLSKKRKLWTSAAEKNLPGDKQCTM